MFRIFDLDLKKLLLVVFVLALPLLSINLQKAPDEAPWYAEPFAFVAGNLQSIYTGFSEGIRNTTSMYVNLVGVKTNSQVLARENAELKARMRDFEDLRAENARLLRLHNFQTRNPIKLLTAQVIGLDLFREHATLRINRGTLDGVKHGQAVITPLGVVGYVYDAEKYHSQVLVLTDRFSVIDGMVARSRARGVIEGSGVDRCRMKYLTRTDDVAIGDLVVTSGLDNVFPKGFPIGVVSNVESKKYGVTQRIEIQPIIDPSRIEEVFVIFQINGPVVAESHIPYANDKPDGKVTN